MYSLYICFCIIKQWPKDNGELIENSKLRLMKDKRNFDYSFTKIDEPTLPQQVPENEYVLHPYWITRLSFYERRFLEYENGFILLTCISVLFNILYPYYTIFYFVFGYFVMGYRKYFKVVGMVWGCYT